MCSTCIYRPESPLDLKKLEDDCRDEHGHLAKYRICHHHQDAAEVCCRGFWQAHREDSTPCQIADRLGRVEFTDDEPDIHRNL